MFNYKILENIAMEILHQAFVEAFSDYAVKMDLPLERFQQMLQRRGFTPELSLGAFDGEKLVGFVFNGFREWDGKLTVYDLGTGVVPEYRRQGITNEMLKRITKMVKEKQAQQYLLEVLQANVSATELYKKQGFKVVRELECYQISASDFVPATTCIVEQIEPQQFSDFMDFTPSWQNSNDSIRAVSESFSYVGVRMNDVIVGYGIIDKKTGDIPQIAVHQKYRGQGIATSIISELIKHTESEKVSLLNVDSQCESLKRFLVARGFTRFVDQYEMILAF
ncbi:GNAT family N-acetyltransferase [Bacillus ndiopicus]|uniref:GNAT family N-acetyltransferase n=1 Tax=Bacillus ndiopicus TaxID=1347368 RepID=UPI0005AA5375|nr:GNAT family N-acetyltransferase [Bacillus ndiopicus]